mgnify:FL=1
MTGLPFSLVADEDHIQRNHKDIQSESSSAAECSRWNFSADKHAASGQTTGKYENTVRQGKISIIDLCHHPHLTI